MVIISNVRSRTFPQEVLEAASFYSSPTYLMAKASFLPMEWMVKLVLLKGLVEEAEAEAQGAELTVLGLGPDWESRFAQGLAAAASADRPVWLTTAMTQAELGEGHDSVMRRCECVNELVDSGRSTTSGGDVIELGPDTRVLFVAPPSAPAAMSPAQIARLGFVDATAPSSE